MSTTRLIKCDGCGVKGEAGEHDFRPEGWRSVSINHPKVRGIEHVYVVCSNCFETCTLIKIVSK